MPSIPNEDTKPPRLSVAQLETLLAEAFPQAFGAGSRLRIVEVGYGACRMRLDPSEADLRPGGTLSGHAIMMLADDAMYIALLATIGWQPLAVTTNLSVNFLSKPAARALIAECRLLKIGKRLVMGEVTIRSEDASAVVAHATSTYSVPPLAAS